MPAQGQRLLAEMRAAGFTFAIGPDRLDTESTPVPLWRPTFVVEPASQLSQAQREALRAHRRSVRLALELELIEARVSDPADGPHSDGMFERWRAQQASHR
jgi:hypothetical protein